MQYWSHVRYAFPLPRTGSRPGGRSARIRSAVHRAVRELLADEADELLTIPVVAARAGVHATTVYRRWGSVGELLADVATSRFSDDIVVPDTGSLRGDLERYASDLAKDLNDPDTLPWCAPPSAPPENKAPAHAPGTPAAAPGHTRTGTRPG
ncbi:hypothetical protein SHKM778_46440 [Streptomyces sp. KM77-8]|uniref:HTH tetR-type domain-containing protein n=1 Tax=Streptomyces haneummycinicus TaxID=3074435 RepID=A0AAT9HLY9_9ACTN